MSSGYRFKVYNTCGSSPENINTLLSADTDGSVDEGQYEIQNLQSTAQTVCQHHREHVSAGSDFDKSLFVIFDREEARMQGVLLVNMDPYHGYPDAVRELPDSAIETLASLSISNTDWYTVRETDEEHKTALVPQDWFALYDMTTSRDDSAGAKTAMNYGLQNVGLDEDEEPASVPPKEIYRGVQTETTNIDEIIARHPAAAADENFSENIFAAIDSSYQTEGPLFVRVHPERDSFRCRGPAAGEILMWIFIGFMMWDEAETFAEQQR